jgi:hydroxymethylglutaryl-CoA synthase
VDDYDYFVFHSPNGKFPIAMGRQLGVPKEKLEDSLVVRQIGNTYSGSAMMGLANVLDIADPGSKIFMVAYGSGAGSDSTSRRSTHGSGLHWKEDIHQLRDLR